MCFSQSNAVLMDPAAQLIFPSFIVVAPPSRTAYLGYCWQKCFRHHHLLRQSGHDPHHHHHQQRLKQHRHDQYGCDKRVHGQHLHDGGQQDVISVTWHNHGGRQHDNNDDGGEEKATERSSRGSKTATGRDGRQDRPAAHPPPLELPPQEVQPQLGRRPAAAV